jgi:glutamate synthase (ferredoxin)
VLDESGGFSRNVNPQMVGVEKLENPAEIAEVRDLIERHAIYTKSVRAATVLSNWDQAVPKVVKIMPRDYKRMLAAIQRVADQGLSGEEAVMVAFEENAKDLARVGGG